MSNFTIAAAQVASVRGDIVQNIAAHATAIEAATNQDVSVLVFPELSLTGYEPDLAAELAMTATDCRLAPLLTLARQHQIELVMGAPLHNGTATPFLGAILVSPQGTTSTYCKMHLGGSEPNHFTPGDKPLAISRNGQTLGVAICADASQATHPQAYAEAGANIYAAGVFLTAEWYATDASRLAGYAVRFQMLILMANHAASIGTNTSVGKSAVWAPDGKLLAQAEGTENALIIATSHNAVWHGEVVRI